jgi:hypothetical protein
MVSQDLKSHSFLEIAVPTNFHPVFSLTLEVILLYILLHSIFKPFLGITHYSLTIWKFHIKVSILVMGGAREDKVVKRWVFAIKIVVPRQPEVKNR